MKFLITTLSFCILTISLYSQSDSVNVKYKIDTLVNRNHLIFISKDYETIPSEFITKIDRPPTFIECADVSDKEERVKCLHKEFYKYLSKNVRYPYEAKLTGIEGQMIISFVVNKKGKVENVRVVKSNDTSGLLNNEAIRVTKKMPRFIPAMHEGALVKVQYQFPIKFSLPK